MGFWVGLAAPFVSSGLSSLVNQAESECRNGEMKVKMKTAKWAISESDQKCAQRQSRKVLCLRSVSMFSVTVIGRPFPMSKFFNFVPTARDAGAKRHHFV